MRVVSMLVIYIALCASLSLVQAESRVVYNEIPLNFSWDVREGRDNGKSLEADTVFGGPAENGEYCSKIVYNRDLEDWANAYVTATGENRAGPGIGLDLTGAKKLVFYAKGRYGDEKITFGYGFEPNQIGFSDSSKARRIENLHKDYWQRYEFDLNGKDLSHINGLFMFGVEKQFNPQGATFYLDNITYVFNFDPQMPVTGITGIDNNTNLQNGTKVAQSATIMGNYSTDNFDDAIWIFVMPLSSGGYYPQYSCFDRTGVTVENGRWEKRIGIGVTNDTGNIFDIIVGLADAEANQSLVSIMNKWCEANKFKGLDKLPEGVNETARISVIRNAESFGPAPSIPNSRLPGTISITDITNGENVSPSRLIHGSLSPDMTSDIWVFIYSSNGRWYPQSINPCINISTKKFGDQWQGSMNFGGESGIPSDIIVVAATPEASKILNNFQKSCCERNSYPGLSTIQLPNGLTEKNRIRVYRK